MTITMHPMPLAEAEQVRKIAQAHGFKVVYIVIDEQCNLVVVEVSK